jgi:hypothetical protein
MQNGAVINTTISPSGTISSTFTPAAAINSVVVGGAAGTNGTNGKDGKDGINGTNGIDGIQGPAGQPNAQATGLFEVDANGQLWSYSVDITGAVITTAVTGAVNTTVFGTLLSVFTLA